ncbi:hypothetical protein CPB85DRAFT_1260091 [Mucidula mucida]|nr:hypothetical protein CPB85DRAFT_1260091 [Mucidula mucida]
MERLKTTRDTAREEHGKSKRSRGKYNHYIKNTRKFHTELVKQRRASGQTYDNAKEFESALNGPPNKYTADIILYFLVQKCFTEECGHSTGDGIHAAWADHYDNMEGYQDPYSYDARNGVRGNPARAQAVMNTVHKIKNRDRKGGAAATRNHAEAITIEEMKQAMEWSFSVCSEVLITRFIRGDSTLTVEERSNVIEHAFMRAFTSTSFTLWTRNFETCQLRRSDITWNLQRQDAYQTPYFTVFLENRKGWQNKSEYDCSRESNTYEIFDQPDVPAINMYYHFHVWMMVLCAILQRDLRPDELVFPQINGNGLVYSQTEFSHSVIQKKIEVFFANAGLERDFTTHSFRRGGAQYQFMFAPIGQHWSLKIVQWWGEWAENEGVNTLMNYLLDSLSRYETSYGDALYTVWIKHDESFMGDRDLVSAPSMFQSQALFTTVHMPTQPSINTGTALSHLSTSHEQTTPLSFGLTPMRTQDSEFAPAPNYQDSSSAALPSANFHSNQQHAPSRGPAGDSGKQMPNSGPPPGYTIPNIPKSHKARNGEPAWKLMIRQWDEQDAATGIALKDWPESWYQGSNKALYSTNEDFTKAYPAANRGIKQLLSAIRLKRDRRCVSKNGMPAERDDKQRRDSVEASSSDEENILYGHVILGTTTLRIETFQLLNYIVTHIIQIIKCSMNMMIHTPVPVWRQRAKSIGIRSKSPWAICMRIRQERIVKRKFGMSWNDGEGASTLRETT